MRTMQFNLSFSDSEFVGYVHGTLKPSDLDLEPEEFWQRYLLPAFCQARDEYRHQKEKAVTT